MFKRLYTSVKDEFSDFLSRILGTKSAKQKFFGALLMGTKKTSREIPFLPPDKFDRFYNLLVDNSSTRERIQKQYDDDPDRFGISLVTSLDKTVFAQLTGRLKPYVYIPTTTGKKALEEVTKYIVSDDGPIARMFDEESGPDGPWKPLSARQLRWRKQRGYALGPILNASGKLREAVTSELLIEDIKGGKYGRAVLGPKNLKANTDALDHIEEKFYVHMLGMNKAFGNKKINIVPRRFMPRNTSDFTEDERIEIAKHIKEGIRLGKLDEAGRFIRDIRGRFTKAEK